MLNVLECDALNRLAAIYSILICYQNNSQIYNISVLN